MSWPLPMEALAAVCAAAAVVCWPWRPRHTPSGPSTDPVSRAGPRGWRRHDTRWVAEFAELASVALRAGLPAGDAGRLAADLVSGADARLTGSVAVAHARGESLGAALRALHAQGAGGRELGFLAGAWELGDELGAATAPAAELAAGVVRQQVEADQRRASAVAGPRTSMWVLTALPLLGPLAVLLMGAPVAETFARPIPLAALVLGMLLTGLGWGLATRMLTRAQRPLGLQREDPG